MNDDPNDATQQNPEDQTGAGGTGEYQEKREEKEKDKGRLKRHRSPSQGVRYI